MPEVILAKSAGFCYGVKRAVELAQQTAAETRPAAGCWETSFTTPMWWRT